MAEQPKDETNPQETDIIKRVEILEAKVKELEANLKTLSDRVAWNHLFPQR